MGVTTQVFSLGDYRRRVIGGAQDIPEDYFKHGVKSPETHALRKKVKDGCEANILNYFNKQRGQVAIYDANNGTKESRNEVAEKFEAAGVHVIFLGKGLRTRASNGRFMETESSCDNDEIVEANIRSVKISSPDYKGWDPEKAVADYWGRIKTHEAQYEPLTELKWPYIKIINVGEKILINAIQGYLQSRIIFFLMNIHNKYRTIYFARSGQSLIEHSFKADSDLSPAGTEYAEKLKDFVLERRRKVQEERSKAGVVQSKRLVVWTSARRRAYHTAWPFVQMGYRVIEKPTMGEINPGVWDGLSPEMAQKRYPDEWERFLRDPYSHRAPRAESYHDLAVRLEPTIIELERENDDLLIIGHASVIRCLLAYLMGLPAHEVPAVEIARGDLLEVVPASYGVHSQAFHFWSGPGRGTGGDGPEENFYENYAEATKPSIKPADPEEMTETTGQDGPKDTQENSVGGTTITLEG
ncbi:hypothetical protein FRB97_000706 [Tulasnella sp. 331]|nr:hypothetical protein FRB97_000706 [Tulasnella sp. 331]